ncbi:ATP-binding protein [Streptomyces sudanensis]|uniref:ATP-binding protein n=1 Tax=Streptomyces sudanensis TaxID=436397 RepID=UPI0020CECAD4|nr:ATP-binding protein [Streptomyces sudanensis]MCP9957650.1 ATP-binding protein [Streptomyces sudanensis]MCQ0001808.1 ATP-binding protein [Streptomyces sudanensis]
MTTTTAGTSGTDDPGYTRTWPCEPESAQRARRLVSTALTLWGMGDVAAAGELIASELVTNAVNHSARRDFRIRISRPGPGTVRILVADTNREEPVPRDPGDDAENGRGLRLVEALSTEWGCDPRPWGKVVWAELRTT